MNRKSAVCLKISGCARRAVAGLQSLCEMAGKERMRGEDMREICEKLSVHALAASLAIILEPWSRKEVAKKWFVAQLRVTPTFLAPILTIRFFRLRLRLAVAINCRRIFSPACLPIQPCVCMVFIIPGGFPLFIVEDGMMEKNSEYLFDNSIHQNQSLIKNNIG
jgi:hypothetical protein